MSMSEALAAGMSLTAGEILRRALAKAYVQLGADFGFSEFAGLLVVGPSEAMQMLRAAEMAGWATREGEFYNTSAWHLTEEGIATCMA